MGGGSGRIGVLIFFCISCVLFYSTPKNKNHSSGPSYILKKIKNMYTHVLASETIMLVIYFYCGHTENLIYRYLIHIFMLESYIPTSVKAFCYCLNEPLWYISMMLLIWFIMPIVQKINIRTSIIMMFAYVFAFAIFTHNYDWIRYFTYICPLFWMLILFVILGLNELDCFNEKSCISASVATVMLFALSIKIPSYLWIPLLVIPCFIFIKSFLMVFDGHIGLDFGSMPARFLAFVGKYSKYIYFYHFILCFALRAILA